MNLQSDELCLKCSNGFSDKDFWDSSPYSKGSLSQQKWGFWFSRYFRDIKNSTCCPICRLVCEALRKRGTPALPADDSTIYYSRVLYGKYEADKSVRYTGKNMRHDPEIPGWELHRTYRLRVSTIFQYDGLTKISDERFLQQRAYETIGGYEAHEGEIMLLSEETGAWKFLHGRKISPRLNFGLAKEWIDTCSENHGPCNQLDGLFESTKPLRVINTEKLMVQETPVECRYAALSYTWGPGTPQLLLRRDIEAQLTRHGGLEEIWERIPRTIKDAITLCRKLKITYLWVDALCRGDGDEYERERRIEDINRVYASAYLTIVGNGRDSQYGLKGVRPGSHRRHQPSERAGQISLAISKPLIDESMSRSGWMWRMWTFSEFLLSRHLLIFTDHQVFFLCKDEDRLYSEDTQCEVPHCDVMKIKNVDLPEVDNFWTSPRGWEGFASYTAYVEEYTKRQMTNENDLASGFKMFRKRLENDLGKDFLYDLPMQFFPQALCFVIFSGKRRTSLRFPSWSWHGWDVSGHNGIEFMSTWGFDKTRRPSTYYYVGKVPETGKLQFMPMGPRQGVERDTMRSPHMCDEIQKLLRFPERYSEIEEHIAQHIHAAAVDEDDHAFALPCPVIMEKLPDEVRENLLVFTALTVELCIYREDDDNNWAVVVPQGGKACLTPAQEKVGHAVLNTTEDYKDGDSFKFILIGHCIPDRGGDENEFLLVTKAAGYKVFHRVGCCTSLDPGRLKERFKSEMVYLI